MNIRFAIPQDASAIAHVHVATWQSTYAGIVPQPFLDDLNQSDFTTRWTDWLGLPDVSICVAEIEGAIVGFASGGPIRRPMAASDAELYAIYLLPEAHRRGIGWQLAAHIQAELLQQGMQHILAWVLRDNPATFFYKSLGGEIVAEDTVEIGGVALQELAYAWPLQASPQSSQGSGGAA